MKRSNLALLAASVVLGMGVTQAHAGFTYDLRVAASGNPTASSNGGHTVTNPTAGVYTLELWGRISGDASPTNDSYSAGWLNLSSSAGAGGLAFSGAGTGVTNLVIPSRFEASVQGAATNTTPDNVQDWASADSTATAGWTLWQTTTPLPAGGATGQAVDANTWEVLLATITVNVQNVSAPSGAEKDTIISVGLPSTVTPTTFGTGPGKSRPIIYSLDGTTSNTGLSAGTGVTFAVTAAVVPEPASLGVLALGALSLVARRRRAK